MYCTHCNINWARLYSHDDTSGDETYEYCPKCGTDMYLEQQQAGPVYMMLMGGEIVEPESGEPLIKETPMPVIEDEPVEDGISREEKERMYEHKQNEAIQAYLDMYDTDRGLAERLFFEKHK